MNRSEKRFSRRGRRAAGAVGWMIVSAAAVASSLPPLTVARRGDALSISLPAAATQAGKLELGIVSVRNARVPRFHDVSPLQPRAWRDPRNAESELWFPVVDLRLEADMSAVVEVAEASPGAQVSFNGWVRCEREPLRARLRFPAERLLHWENTLWIDRREPAIARFQLRKPVPAGHGETGIVPREVRLELLDRDWAGRIELIALDEDGRETVLAAQELAPPGALGFSGRDVRRPEGTGLARGRLREALVAAIGHILSGQVEDPRDPMRGGLYLFYDLDGRTYRTSHWVWGWGPPAGLLLEARRSPDVTARLPAERLLAAARGIGEASLRSVPADPRHPARGMPVSRWDRAPRFECGHALAFTPSDAGFLAGWSWVPLAEATGETRWREASLRLVDALEQLMRKHSVPPQNYWPDREQWDDHVIDEAGFGVELFARLHRLTGDARLRDLGRRYLEQHLAALGRPDGLWDRVHYLNGRPNAPTIRLTRGMGWPMEGLLAAHRLLPDDGKYLELARRMAEHLLAAQKPEGWWSHRFAEPAETWGVGMKGTALWCWLLYELHARTGDPRHREGARRALRWLLDQQYFGDDERARGGHVTVSPHSAVGPRPWFRVTCVYGSAFFGLAILRELELPEEAER